MMNAKLRRIGDEVVVALPEEWLKEARLGDGDDVTLRVTDGELVLSAADLDVDRAMEIARRGMRKYRNALAALAK